MHGKVIFLLRDSEFRLRFAGLIIAPYDSPEVEVYGVTSLGVIHENRVDERPSNSFQCLTSAIGAVCSISCKIGNTLLSAL